MPMSSPVTSFPHHSARPRSVRVPRARCLQWHRGRRWREARHRETPTRQDPSADHGPGADRTRSRQAAHHRWPEQAPVQLPNPAVHQHVVRYVQRALGDDLPARWPPAGHREGRANCVCSIPPRRPPAPSPARRRWQYGGQGGFGDVVLHPQFASNRYVYLSYAEAGPNSTRGATVIRAQLTLDANGGGSLGTSQVIWQQTPKVSGRGPLWSSHGLRRRRQAVDHLQRPSEDDAGAGHGQQPGQAGPPQRQWHHAERQPVLRAGRCARADLVAGSSQHAGHRLRRRRQAVGARDGPGRRRRTQPDRTWFELRMAGGLQRQPLRRCQHSGPRHAT